MPKIISYKLVSGEKNIGTKEEPIIEPIISPAKIECPTKASFDANYPIAEKEAIPGTIEVSGEFDPEPDNSTTDEVLNTLLGV